MHTISGYIGKLFNTSSLLSGAGGIGIAIMSYGASFPSLWKSLVLVCASAFVLDTISGIILAKQKRDVICDTKFNRSFIKFIIYVCAFIVALSVDEMTHVVLGTHNSFLFSFGILCAIASREVVSVFRNLKELSKIIKEPWIFDKVEEGIGDVLNEVSEAEENTEEVDHEKSRKEHIGD